MIQDDLPSDKPVVFSNFLHCIRVDENQILPMYVYAYLRTLYHLNYMEYIQNQTTGIKNLLMDDFMGIGIPVENSTKQKEFALKLVDTVNKTKSTIKNAYANLEETRSKLADEILHSK